MIEESAVFLSLSMLMSAAAGFISGAALGDSFRHRKCLQQIKNLRDQLERTYPYKEPLGPELERLRGELNDIHKHVVALSKALNRPSAK
jgi:hypothetical protein